MQAIAETLFDIVYLTTVITLGVRMIRGCKGNPQFRLFGIMAVVLGSGDSFHLVPRAVALCTTGLENYTAALGIGKLVTSVTMTIFYVLLYYVWRQRYHIQGKNLLTASVYPVAQRESSPLLGHLPQYPLCPAGTGNHCPVLPQRQRTPGRRLPLDVAHHYTELRLLHPGGAVG